MSRLEWRLIAAFCIGVLFDEVFFWKFQPYSVREHSPGLLPGFLLPILAFVLGLLLTFAAKGKRRWVPGAMLAGFCVANAVLIVADCRSDPTNHNLWPFEFVIIAVATAPAFLGAGVSTLIARSRQPKSP